MKRDSQYLAVKILYIHKALIWKTLIKIYLRKETFFFSILHLHCASLLIL